MGCGSLRLAGVAVLISCLCASPARAADVQADFDFPSSTLPLAVDDPDNSSARRPPPPTSRPFKPRCRDAQSLRTVQSSHLLSRCDNRCRKVGTTPATNQRD